MIEIRLKPTHVTKLPPGNQPRVNKPLPPMTKRIRNFAGALVDHAAAKLAGERNLTDEEAKVRAIAWGCIHRDGTRKCDDFRDDWHCASDGCGCPMNRKLKWPRAKCGRQILAERAARAARRNVPRKVT